MNLEQKRVVIERLNCNEDHAKFLCENFIFDVEDVNLSDQDGAGVIKYRVSSRRLTSTKLQNFKFNSLRLLETLVDAENLFNDNMLLIILSFLKLIRRFVSSITIDLKRDHGILIVCLSQLNGYITPLDEERAFMHFNAIKTNISEEKVTYEKFSCLIDDLARLKTISLIEGKILLKECILFKTTLYEIFK